MHPLPVQRTRGTLGSRVTCFAKGLPSLGALGVANPKLVCPVWEEFLGLQFPAFSTTLCHPVPEGEGVPQILPPEGSAIP